MQYFKYLEISRFLHRAGLFTTMLLLVATLYSCGSSNTGPDVSGVKVALNTRRLDQDIAKLDTNNLGAGLRQLAGKYPDFLSFYLDTLMGMGIQGRYLDSDTAVHNRLRGFLTQKDFRGLFDTVAKHFPDTKSIDDNLVQGFQHLKYYYPQSKEPKIIYFTSWLNNWSAITYGDNIVGIGLDMALGENYPYYNSVGIPAYAARNLTAEAMPVNVFRALYSLKQPFVKEGRNLLDMMIQRGKEQYFLSRMLPFLPDSLRLGFTASQTAWCKQNEAGIYNFFIKSNMLYNSEWGTILRYVTDGPEAAGMAPESPGNVGTYLGWRIVEAYYQQHPKLKLDEVLALQDAQQILQDAKYKP